MTTYIALLRGINVGGNKKVPMKDLQDLLNQLDYENPRTVLASGNAIFETKEKTEQIKAKIEKGIEEKFEFSVSIQIFEQNKIKNVIDQNPFKNAATGKGIKHYVTFLNQSSQKAPQPKETNFQIIDQKDGLLFTLIDTTQYSSIDLMNYLGKTFGKEVTTRTWATVEKIAKK